MISIDSESTGVDILHGARPWFVTTCDQDGYQRWWEWPVDPITRDVDVDQVDVEAIQELIDRHDEVAAHNMKFDLRILWSVGVSIPKEKIRCTHFGSHILASNHAHDLYSTAVEHLGVSPRKLERLENDVKEATKECRRQIRAGEWNHLGCDRWRLAKEGDPMMPSVNDSSKRDEDKSWKGDMWLMRAIASAIVGRHAVDLERFELDMLEEQGFPLDWLDVAPRYANGDSAITAPLWQFMKGEIERRKLTRIFMHNLKLVPIAAKLEESGVTASGEQTDKQIAEYSEHVDLCQAECLAMADQLDFKLELPDSASPNDSIREFFWGAARLLCPRCKTETKHKEWEKGSVWLADATCPKCLKRKAKPGPATVERRIITNPCLGLEPIISEKTGNPSLDKDALAHYEKTLEPGLARDFIRELTGMRSRQTAVSYMQSYKRFWLPTQNRGWFRLAPSLNPRGTDHLRWASYNPNSQNISKKEGFNLRRCFGPMPWREWWSMDAQNLELRIPAFEADETDLVWVFNHPNDGPYYGSYHLVVFDTLHPELFAKHGKEVKDLFESTWYQWVKNGNFAVIYGCQRKKADETYHVPGAFDKISRRFPRIAALAARQIDLARRRGWVETIPDRHVDPERGYPILASRTDDGHVMPTTPLNYHISGTAMQWTNSAMIRCDEEIGWWNDEGWDGFITLQVHDELVFDCPAGTGVEPWTTNLDRMRRMRELMQLGGDDIGVPTPVAMEWHAENWSTGRKMS